MTTNRLTAGASRFAHFAGLSRKSSHAAAEDDKSDDGPDAEEDDDGKDAEDDEPKETETKGKKGSKAKRADENESDDGDDEPRSKGKKSKRADDDDDDIDDDEAPKAKSKKSRAAEDDDDDDGDDKREMTGNSATASARRRERARCAAIFAHKSAANNIALAMSLAFETTMTRQEAVAVMRGQTGNSVDTAPTRSPREARNSDLGASDEPGGNKPKAGATWGRSFTKLGFAPRA